MKIVLAKMARNVSNNCTEFKRKKLILELHGNMPVLRPSDSIDGKQTSFIIDYYYSWVWPTNETILSACWNGSKFFSMSHSFSSNLFTLCIYLCIYLFMLEHMHTNCKGHLTVR